MTTTMTDDELLAIAGTIPSSFTQLGIERELLPALRRAASGDLGGPLADGEYILDCAIWQKYAVIRVAEAAGFRVMNRAGRSWIARQL